MVAAAEQAHRMQQAAAAAGGDSQQQGLFAVRRLPSMEGLAGLAAGGCTALG